MSSIEPPILVYQTTPLEFKSNRTRTVITLSALGLILLSLLGCTAVGFMQLSLLHRAAAGEPISTTDAHLNDTLYVGAHMTMLAMLLFCMAAIPVWMYRAHKNLRPLPQRKLEFTPGGAVGWWFCPFLNLVRPYQVMKEIVRVSDEGVQQQLSDRAYPLIGLWWFFWIVGNVIARIATAIAQPSGPAADRAATINNLINQTWAGMFGIPFSLIAGAMLMWIIVSVERMQSNQASAQLEPARVSPQPPNPPLL